MRFVFLFAFNSFSWTLKPYSFLLTKTIMVKVPFTEFHSKFNCKWVQILEEILSKRLQISKVKFNRENVDKKTNQPKIVFWKVKLFPFNFDFSITTLDTISNRNWIRMNSWYWKTSCLWTNKIYNYWSA